MKFIKQCKGKDLSKVPKSKLLQEGWYGSIKYDGNYVQIHKRGVEVRFYTSGGKEFYLPDIAEQLVKSQRDANYIVECEYMHDCEGRLGDRVHSSRLTTYRTAFGKHPRDIRKLDSSKDVFRAFNLIQHSYGKGGKEYIDDTTAYQIRLSLLYNLLGGEHVGQVHAVTNTQDTLPNLVELARRLRQLENWEGLFLTHKTHTNQTGKRTNLAIKLKYRPTADLVCIGWADGEGKYEGMIGSLLLEDSEGVRVSVGTGLNDADRARDPEEYVGKIIEIEYEQIIDTYIQPVFKCIREDKHESD